MFSEEQNKIINYFEKSQDSIFITGSAGCGKSHVLREIIKKCTKSHLVTASTGAAAQLLTNGLTLHMALGIGILGSESVSKAMALRMIQHVEKRNRQEAWLVDVLFIDEISMISGELFDNLDEIAKHLRNNNSPMGGLRIVACGDFLQLGPVNGKYAFQSNVWQKLFSVKNSFYLNKSFRCADGEFQKILNNIRWGICDKLDVVTLYKTVSNKFSDSIHITYFNRDVDEQNLKKFKSLNTHSIKYLGKIEIDGDPVLPSEYDNKLVKDVELCVGCRVMHTTNDLPLVNGSLGTVVEVDEKYVVVNFDKIGVKKVHYYVRNIDDPAWPNKIITISFMPLVPAWAITVHKSQGCTLENGILDMKNAFGFATVYTALSRFKNMNSFCLTSFNPQSVKCSDLCKEYYTHMNSRENVVVHNEHVDLILNNISAN